MPVSTPLSDQPDQLFPTSPTNTKEVVEGFPKLKELPPAVHKWACKYDNPQCTRSAPCRRCLGSRNRRKGQRKQRQAKKIMGVPHAPTHGLEADEEHWRHWVRIEVKAGAQVKGIASRYLAAEAQSAGAKAIGDMRPFCMVAMPDGWGQEGLVVLRASVFNSLAALALAPVEPSPPTPAP